MVSVPSPQNALSLPDVDRRDVFEVEDQDAVIAQINAARSHVLLVAMGVPHQELRVVRNVEHLTVGVAMGVGGQFDFHSGRSPRASTWLRRLGCEWMFHLRQEPLCMWRRYVLGNLAFVLSILKERVQAERRAQALRALETALFSEPGSGQAKSLHQSVSAWFHRASKPIHRILKRSLDVVGAGCALVMLSPLLLVAAAAIRLESPGPVLFTQSRVGEGGRLFKVFKMRSMYRDAEARKAALMAKNEMAGGVLFKMKNDPRITKVGKVIRKTSIDELPQLWNVLKGDMSLVGPRPALPEEVAQYSAVERRRLDGKPGITCIWQVSGRSSIPFEGQVRMDIAYNESPSLWMDILLLLKTIPAVLFARGAH
ncbi:WecB/TagA/CpsF family glycosyltransferase [Rhodospirillum sp. A1_3_36]|uniref:WecB/TagA/CpsF family glycosyltransferase n=1 Tax=Rhodospirillum sp. A1_3_36 TaxID=3391666 RepID=UPI0039A63D8A